MVSYMNILLGLILAILLCLSLWHEDEDKLQGDAEAHSMTLRPELCESWMRSREMQSGKCEEWLSKTVLVWSHGRDGGELAVDEMGEQRRGGQCWGNMEEEEGSHPGNPHRNGFHNNGTIPCCLCDGKTLSVVCFAAVAQVLPCSHLVGSLHQGCFNHISMNGLCGGVEEGEARISNLGDKFKSDLLRAMSREAISLSR